MKHLFLFGSSIILFFLLFNDLTAQQEDNILSIRINDIHYGFISRDTILKYPVLKCSLDNFKVTSFTLSYILDGKSFKIQGSGDLLNDIMIQAIKKIESGKNIHFEDVIVTHYMSDKNTVTTYGPFFYTIY